MPIHLWGWQKYWSFSFCSHSHDQNRHESALPENRNTHRHAIWQAPLGRYFVCIFWKFFWDGQFNAGRLYFNLAKISLTQSYWFLWMTSKCSNRGLLGQNLFIAEGLIIGVLQKQHGYKFISETDTEVIVKLSQYIYDNSAVKPTFPEVGFCSELPIRWPTIGLTYINKMRLMKICVLFIAPRFNSEPTGDSEYGLQMAWISSECVCKVCWANVTILLFQEINCRKT